MMMRKRYSAIRPYSPFVDKVLRGDKLMHSLIAKDVLEVALLLEVRGASDEFIFGGQVPQAPNVAKLIRGGLLNALDAIDEAHRIFQDDSSDLGAYWHGIMHRREGDFDNARYWFRRAGSLPWFAECHREAANISADVAKQSNWDAYLMTGQCEQDRFGAEELTDELLELQWTEFNHLFDYTWRSAKFSPAPTEATEAEATPPPPESTEEQAASEPVKNRPAASKDPHKPGLDFTNLRFESSAPLNS